VGGKQRTVVLFGGIEVFPDRRHKHASRRDDSELARVPAQDIDELGALVDRACWSFTGTNDMLGHVTASLIAAASIASVLPRLT